MDKKFYMIQAWDLKIKEIELASITKFFYITKKGHRIPHISKDEIIGETIEEAKKKYIAMVLSDIHDLEDKIERLYNKIDTVIHRKLEEK
jgi:hypothetical protein